MIEEFISVSDLRKVTATQLRESKSVMVIVSKAQPRAVIIPYSMFTNRGHTMTTGSQGLSEMEQLRTENKLLWTALTNEVGAERVYALTEVVLAARQAQPPTAPERVQAGHDDLVQQMLDAYWQDARPCERCAEDQRSGMTAALGVALADALRPVTDEEFAAYGRDVNEIFAGRLRKLQPEVSK
jgi:hypothetical protein